MTDAKWDRRIRRATELASTQPFAAEGLRFYTRIATFQRSLYADIQKALTGATKAPADRPLRDELDLFLLLPKFSGFLSIVQQVSPPPLARAAAALAQQGPAAWQRVIEDFWHSDLDMPVLTAGNLDDDQSESPAGPTVSDRLLAWIFLQPYAEYLADSREPEHLDGTPSTCPLCGGKPIVGVLRPEGDGAKKSLVCMLCAHEWAFRRIYCPACGEEREPQMAFYSAPEIAHVRVDVCDTCHTYLKSVDLTKMGLAVPIVDELATIPLDLWAREHGYEKLQMNLLGT
ncbi:MAG: formate dehydrogenase accessory protein FdhE [Candidatus Acidiferrales bacterium]